MAFIESINLTYLQFGNLFGSRDLTLKVTNGEGQTWLDPAVIPTLRTITQGKLVVASESFPRFAPLTMTLTVADPCFLVHRGRLLNLGQGAGNDTVVQSCISIPPFSGPPSVTSTAGMDT